MRITPTNLQEVLQVLATQPVLAFDTETTGLEQTDYPFALVVTSPKDTYYFDSRVVPWRDAQGIKDLFAMPKLWVAQNFKFDARMLETSGITIGGTWVDIAVMARIVDNTHMSYSLENQAKRHGHELKIDVKPDLKEHKCYEMRTPRLGDVVEHPRYDLCPIDIMEPYACQDGKLTLDLFEHYLSLMDSQDSHVWENECHITKVCYAMERRGVRLDFDYAMEAYE